MRLAPNRSLATRRADTMAASSLRDASHDYLQPPHRPRLGAHPRLRPADLLPRRHVLRDLGLAREVAVRLAHHRAADDAQLAVAAEPAVLRVRLRDLVPACEVRDRLRALAHAAAADPARAGRVAD